MWGITVTVVVPCMVSHCGHCATCGVKSPSLCHIWCCSCGHCAIWGVTVIAPHGVSQLLHHVGCHSCCTVWGVVVIAPHAVSWLLHHMGCCGCCAAWGVIVVAPCPVLQSQYHSCSHCAVCGVAVMGGRGWPCVRWRGRWEVEGRSVLHSEVEKKKKLHTISNKYICFLESL